MRKLTQIMYWMVEVQNFILECFCMQINLGILLVYQQLNNVYILSYIVVCEIIVFYKYSHNINERKLFLALQNFQQWEKLTDQILPNHYIVQKFDNITGQIDVYDCNKIAQKHNIHVNQQNYIDFLLKLELDTQFFNSNNPLKLSGPRTLKDYLLEMHSDLYKDLEDRKKNKKPLNMIQPIDLELGRKKKLSNKSEDNEIGSNELIVENLRVYFKNKEKKKLQTFKVKVVPFYLNPNQPLLIICLEDISLFTSLRNLKSQKEFQSDLYNSSFNCLSQKFSNILSSEVIRLKNLQRQILYCKNIIQAVGNEEVKVRISKFSLSDIISKILKFYSDYNISVVHKNADRLNVQSDQFYCFKILLAILSGINLKSLIKIVTKIKQKSHYDIIKVKFKVTNCNSEDTQSLDIEENTLNNLGVYSNMNVHSITQLNNNLTQTYSNLRNTVSVLNQSSPLLLLKQKTNQTNAPFQEEQDLSFYESQGYSLVVETCDKYIKKYLQKVCFKNYIKITKKESHRIYSIGIFVDLEKITSSNETKN